MTDKEFDKQKLRIKKLKDKWMDLLWLNQYWVEFDYIRETPGPESKTDYSPQDIGGYWEVVMETRSDPYYLKASVTVYTIQTAKLNDDQLEETFLHELCHIHLSPLHTKAKSNDEERVVTMLARALQSSWRHK